MAVGIRCLSVGERARMCAAHSPLWRLYVPTVAATAAAVDQCGPFVPGGDCGASRAASQVRRRSADTRTAIIDNVRLCGVLWYARLIACGTSASGLRAGSPAGRRGPRKEVDYGASPDANAA